jgi:hypothetical protein
VCILSRAVTAAAIILSVSACANPSPKPTPTTRQCSVTWWGCTSTYGAVAWSRGGWGSATNYGSRAAAEAAALASCGEHATDCSVVLWFSNSCGALASAPTGETGLASAQSGDLAETLALGYCMSK